MLTQVYGAGHYPLDFAGNPFPTTLDLPTVAQHGDTFYIVGGYDPTASDLDTIYRYEVEEDSWTLLPNRMTYTREAPTAMVVKSSIFPSCDL